MKVRNKNGTEVTLNLSSIVFGESNDKTNFPYKLLLTDTQFWTLHKAFTNGSSANIKLSKTHLSKMIQLGAFFPIFDLMTMTTLNGTKML